MNELEKFNYTQDDEIDLFELIDILIKRKLFIIISFVIFTVIGLGGALYYRATKPFILAKQFSINYAVAERDYFFSKSKLILKQVNPDNIFLTDKYIDKFFSIKELEELYKESAPKDDYSKVKFLKEIIKINYDEKSKNYTLEVEMKKNEALQKEIINTYTSLLKDEIQNDIIKNIEDRYSTVKIENEKAKNELAEIEKEISELISKNSNMISEKTSIEEILRLVNPSIMIEKNIISDTYNTTSNLLIGFDNLKENENFDALINNIIRDNSSIYSVEFKSKAKFILLGVSIFGIVFGVMGAFVLEFIENYKKSRA